ncbi:MAG: beta-ketoacyl synthase N-terminal-like domain-containing protein, partial [Myxococcota bacterium]
MSSNERAGPAAGARTVDDRDALLREAALELRSLRTELEARDAAERAPIAITGLACRLPGGIETPEAFWSALDRGFDATREIPADRWDVDAWYDPDPDVPGRMYTKHGAFLDDAAGFDPGFFGISPREARNLDPQQRLLLECAHEAFENAGLPIESLRGSRTGVYVGLSLDDYASRTVRSGDPERIDGHSALGTQRAIAAGRIAYTFGLNGPALQIDTTCSSSLVAVHLACQALRNREIDRALVAGVNLVLTPESMIGCCKLRALSSDGRCKTFSDEADGYGRGEGCGAFVLSRAGDTDPDETIALIRGSAINHDGRSNGLTAPSRAAQTEVIRAALADAGLGGDDVDYVEAHGTGTTLGDPIELEALHDALEPRARACLVGSVKTNVGHLESAAGAAGLLKLVLALSARRIPRHLHCERPSTRIDWARLGFAIPGRAIDWPESDRPRRAGVSSFGMSGTNAHVVVESVDSPASRLAVGAVPARARARAASNVRDETSSAARPAVLALSARSAPHLRALAARYVDWTRDAGEALASRCDFYFTTPGLGPIGRALAASEELARALRVILTLAVGYNVIAVGLALAGLMQPWLAAILLPASSLLTVAYT